MCPRTVVFPRHNRSEAHGEFVYRLFLIALVVGDLGLAASVAQSDLGQALLRMERAQAGEVTCVLIHDSGAYRLEKMFRAKTEIYRGNVGAAGVEQLRGLLANGQLKNVSQDKIHAPLITDTLDDLQFAIWRNGDWQELTFLSPSSRKPFEESVDPLVRWFQDLRKKRPGAARVDESPTRCMPTAPSRLTVKAAAEVTPHPARQVDYLFLLRTSHAYGARVESLCTIVFGDGRFHQERQGQTYGADRQDIVVDGQLDSEAMQELKGLLEAKELRESSGDSDADIGRPMMEGNWTGLVVPRDGKVQKLVFSTAVNTFGHPREVGGLSNMTYHIADQKVLDPLLRWTKQHVRGTEKEQLGNDCSPAKTVNPSPESPK
jgi:hypothetical protein